MLAVFVLGSAIAPSAGAESSPFFSITGTRLAAGKTHNIAERSIKKFEMIVAAAGVNITCNKLTVENGVLLGSEPGTEGKASQVNAFSECKLESGNGVPNCHLAATEGGSATSTAITTNLISSELVENVEGGKGGKKLEQLYSPASGSVFATIFFGGTGCEVLATKETGKTAAEIVTDAGEANIELPGPTPENTSFIIRWPATTITEVWLVSAGTGKIVKVEEDLFANVASHHGTALVLLANTKCEPESTKWSPLP